MTSSEFLFWQYRISTLFLLLCLPFLLPVRTSRKKTWGLLGACYFLTGILDYVCFLYMGNPEIPFWLTLAEIPLIQAMPFLLSVYRDFRALFVGLTAAAYVMAGNVCGGALYLYGANLFLCMAVQGAVHALLLWLMVRFAGRGMKACMEETAVDWRELCLIPALFYVIVYMLAVWPVNFTENHKLLFPAFGVLVLMAMAYILLFQTLYRVNDARERQRSGALLDLYAESLKRETEKVQLQKRETAILHHDLRHYMLMVNACLDNGDPEELRRVAAELNGKIQSTEAAEFCSHPVLNQILSYYQRLAEQQNVRFSCDMRIPAKLNVNDYEFAAVVSNLLDNAVRAASAPEKAEDRFVRARADLSGEKLFLEIVNGCREAPKISAGTGLPVSERGEGHGYGLASVLAFVRKTQALFDCEAKEGSFCIRILLQ